MVKCIVLLVSTHFFGVTVLAQNAEYAVSKQAFTSVNSDSEEFIPLLIGAGKELCFSRAMHSQNKGGIYSGADVWMVQWDNNSKQWVNASNNEKNINNADNNVVVGSNEEGNVLYLLNTTGKKLPTGIYLVRKKDEQWMKPELVPIPGLHSQSFIGAYASTDLEVILLSMKGENSIGEEDLYVSLKNADGKWQEPKHLGATINTKGFEISPFLSRDKNRLYFASNGHQGLGDADIFFSDRLYGTWDTWTVPQNLGDKINSTYFDAYFSIYGDSVGFFSSNRESKLADLYQFTVSKKLRAGGGYKSLSPEEMVELLGENVTTTFSFEENQMTLPAQQTEILFYIVAKVAKRNDLSVQLKVVEGNRPDLLEKRILLMTDVIRNAGLNTSRIDWDKSAPLHEDSNHTVVELLILKQ